MSLHQTSVLIRLLKKLIGDLKQKAKVALFFFAFYVFLSLIIQFKENSNDLKTNNNNNGNKKDMQSSSPNSELSSLSFNSDNKQFQNKLKTEEDGEEDETRPSNEYFLLKNTSQNFLADPIDGFYPMRNFYIYDKM
jgi:hypothetical protein